MRFVVTVNQCAVMHIFVQVWIAGHVLVSSCGNDMAVIVPLQCGLVDMIQKRLHKGDLILVTGSFYTVADARPLFVGA
jgi:hypothetical protein